MIVCCCISCQLITIAYGCHFLNFASRLEMCTGRKFRPGPQFPGHFAARPAVCNNGPDPRVTAIVRPWRKWCAVMVMGGFHVSSDRILYYGNNISRRSAADHSSLCCKLGENISLLLRKFSKVRTRRRRPDPARSKPRPAPFSSLFSSRPVLISVHD